MCVPDGMAKECDPHVEEDTQDSAQHQRQVPAPGLIQQSETTTLYTLLYTSRRCEATPHGFSSR